MSNGSVWKWLENGLSWLLGWFTFSTLLMIVLTIVILVIGVIINRITTFTLKKAVEGKIEKGTMKQLLRFKKYLVYGIVLLLILGVYGISPTVLATTFGFLGLAIGFAARDIISNFLAGILLILERNYSVGDVVKIGDTVGIVEMTKLRTTEISTFDGNSVHVPNASIFSGTVINMTSGSSYIQSTVWCKVAYEADIEKVKQIMEQAAKEVAGAVVNDKYKTFFEIKEVDDQWGLRVEMLFYLRAHQEPWIRSKVQQKVMEKMVESDIPLHTLASRPSK